MELQTLAEILGSSTYEYHESIETTSNNPSSEIMKDGDITDNRQINGSNTEIATNTEKSDLKCTTCCKEFKTKRAITRHLKIHSGIRKFECPYCDKTFVEAGSLTKHKMRHLNDKRFQCIMCNMRFYAKSELVIHFRIHSGEKPFKCEQCEKRFASRKLLNSHSKV